MSDYTDCHPWLSYAEWCAELEGHRPGAVAELGDSAEREYRAGCGAAWVAEQMGRV